MKTEFYKVTIRTKIPYLTSIFFGLFLLFIAFDLIGGLILLPAKNSPLEMQVVYYFFFLPDNIQKFIAYSSLGMVTSLILYRYVRTHQNAKLTFLKDRICIDGKSIKENINLLNLRKVTFIDKTDNSNISEEIFIVYFEQSSKQSIRLRLENYEESEEFMNEFMLYLPYKNVKYEFENIDYNLDLSRESAIKNLELKRPLRS